MKVKPTYNLLTTNLFLLGLFLLLLNDFYLKYQYSNFITGKLSDFAGLFIFPFFISVFIPRPKILYFLTALFFIFWKLEISQPFIDGISTLTNLGFYRTVDPTDLFALIVLPFSFYYFRQKSNNHERKSKLGLSVALSVISLFSFCATSLPRKTFDTNVISGKSFSLDMTKSDIFKILGYYDSNNDTLNKNQADTLFRLYFQIPDYHAEVTAIATIKSKGIDSTIIRLDSITQYMINGALFQGINQSDIEGCKNMTIKGYELNFEKNYIDRIKKNKNNSFYFDNMVHKTLKNYYR